ncbi:MAG TPA: phosphodiesterase [Acidisphaera sp.]|nr:phosphodiesterase [Acidisphaera sp.]
MIIAQLTDLHVRPRGEACYRVVETNMLTERAFRAVARLRPTPDVVLITGDVTDCGLPDEYALLKEMLARHLPHAYLIPGNHDRRANMIEALGCPVAETGFIDYVIDAGPVRVVMLDTVVPGAGHGELRAAQLDWLDRTLADKRDTPTMIGMHHPPFLCGIGHIDAINLRNADAFAAVVARHRQVERIVCGHNHRTITARVGHAIATIAPSVGAQVMLEVRQDAPSAFVLEPPAYQIHAWLPGAGFITHTACVDDYPGPFPFTTPPEYPGRPSQT